LGHRGQGPDFVILSLHLAGISSLGGRINFWSTIKNFLIMSFSFLCLRLFSWRILVRVFLLLISLPVLAGGITIILFDRNFNSSFFDRS